VLLEAFDCRLPMMIMGHYAHWGPRLVVVLDVEQVVYSLRLVGRNHTRSTGCHKLQYRRVQHVACPLPKLEQKQT
jgi:hypothetical protein